MDSTIITSSSIPEDIPTVLFYEFRLVTEQTNTSNPEKAPVETHLTPQANLTLVNSAAYGTNKYGVNITTNSHIASQT